MISVIIPVYNGEKYIERALNSVLKQNTDNYEIIVINDGSSDNTINIIEDFWKKFSPNGIYITIKNSGSAVARNVGLELSSGKYILFLDSDDYLSNNILNKLESAIKETYSDIYYYGYNDVDERYVKQGEYSDSFKYVNNLTGRTALLNKLIRRIWICHGNAIYSSDLIKKNNIKYLPGIHHGEDLYFICTALSFAKNVNCINTIGINIVSRQDSVMHCDYNENFNETIIAAKMMLNKILENPIYKNDILVKNILHKEIIEQMCYVSKKIVKDNRLSFGEKAQAIRNIKRNYPLCLNKIKSVLAKRKIIEYYILYKSTFCYIIITKIHNYIAKYVK